MHLDSILEIVQVEKHVPKSACNQRLGRKLEKREALARAFVAKLLYRHPTTRDLIRAVHSNPNLRTISGFETIGDIPSESTFSRAFGEHREHSDKQEGLDFTKIISSSFYGFPQVTRSVVWLFLDKYAIILASVSDKVFSSNIDTPSPSFLIFFIMSFSDVLPFLLSSSGKVDFLSDVTIHGVMTILVKR